MYILVNFLAEAGNNVFLGHIRAESKNKCYETEKIVPHAPI